METRPPSRETIPTMNPDKVRFANPPISEVGLTVMFDAPTVYAPYNVATFHGLVRDDYPFAQQQPPLVDLAPFPTHGDPAPEVGIRFGEAPTLNRWWFMTADARRVLQVQENMLALNWRKFAGEGTAGPYPGFSQLLAEFERYVDGVRSVSRPSGFQFPKPVMCELLLDNLVPLEHGDKAFRMSEALAIIAPAKARDPRPLLAFQMNWFERMEGREISEPQDFSVRVAVVGAQIGAEPESQMYARIVMAARTSVSEWADVPAFFVRARDHATMRLLELTTEEAQATWA